MIEPTRRSFLRGLGFIACAPAIVRASSLMPMRPAPNFIGIDWGGKDSTVIWLLKQRPVAPEAAYLEWFQERIVATFVYNAAVEAGT